MSFSVVLLKQKLRPIWLIQNVLWECYTIIHWWSLFSYNSTQRFLLPLRLNDSSVLADKSRQQDGIASYTNFEKLLLIIANLVMFETLKRVDYGIYCDSVNCSNNNLNLMRHVALFEFTVSWWFNSFDKWVWVNSFLVWVYPTLAAKTCWLFRHNIFFLESDVVCGTRQPNRQQNLGRPVVTGMSIVLQILFVMWIAS